MATKDQRERIRQIFAAKGGLLTTRDLALTTLQEGLVTDDDLRQLGFRAWQAQCRRALVERDAAGLPYAQPLGEAGPEDDEGGDEEEAGPPWQQLSLFTYEQTADLIRRRIKSEADYHEQTRTIHTWCRKRFGKAPKIPSLG